MERIRGLTNNLNRAINVLSSAHPKGIPAPERDVLLSFEALCVEVLQQAASLEQDTAPEYLATVRTLQEMVEAAIGR